MREHPGRSAAYGTKTVMGRTVVSRGSFWRAAAVSAQVATVRKDQRTVFNFACFCDVKGSILGFALNEFGTAASARITLTGPVNRQTISNRDGFFAFEDLPPGEYLVGWCNDPVKASVRNGAPAFAMMDCS
jgi:hypothetical protein